jgi:hypothetical protein
MFYQRGQPFHAERQMRPAAIANHGMNFIHDQGADRGENFATRIGSQEKVK